MMMMIIIIIIIMAISKKSNRHNKTEIAPSSASHALVPTTRIRLDRTRTESV
jgi:hypothetical protein